MGERLKVILSQSDRRKRTRLYGLLYRAELWLALQTGWFWFGAGMAFAFTSIGLLTLIGHTTALALFCSAFTSATVAWTYRTK